MQKILPESGVIGVPVSHHEVQRLLELVSGEVGKG